jgi:L-aspartate oxidase
MMEITQPLKFHRPSAPDRVIIAGGGLAGLFTALKLAPLPVTILTPRPLGEGASSAWAQGGIAAAIGEGDTPEAHAADTIAAGGGLVDEAVAALLAREAPLRIEDLLRYGVPFDRDIEGKLSLSREAAHGARRIVHVNGDQAGKAVMAALITQVALTPSITVLENVEALDLIAPEGRVTGIRMARAGESRAAELYGRAIVLATGGLGQLFRVTTNPLEAKGDGLALAARAGAAIADAEFVQFHPTAFDIGRDPAPLASEALRGEGATLINKAGERFLRALHPAEELAPRDVVARAVHGEIEAGRGAFLDCRAIGLERHFPAAYRFCREAGIDPDSQPIPVAPAAHYHMGGIVTDIRGRTTLSGLWACGEAASTGAHGANRLASNSLLEAVVFGARVAEDISSEAHHWFAMGEAKGGHSALAPVPAFAADAEVSRNLRAVLSAQLGVERSGEGIASALRFIAEARARAISKRMDNRLIAALFVAVGAWRRRESRGAHFRKDFPARSAGPARRSFLTLRQAEAIMREAIGQEREPAAPHERLRQHQTAI